MSKVASAFVAPVERVTTLVTDSDTDPKTLIRLRDMGIGVIIADGDIIADAEGNGA